MNVPVWQILTVAFLGSVAGVGVFARYVGAPSTAPMCQTDHRLISRQGQKCYWVYAIEKEKLELGVIEVKCELP